MNRETLTRWEWQGLRGDYNLADGHAHQGQNHGQLELLRDLGRLYLAAEATEQSRLQEDFRRQFFRLACQPGQDGLKALYHYSASMSIDVAAMYLSTTCQSVNLIHPTFDNIPAILTRRGLKLKPLDEEALKRPSEALAKADGESVFLVCPNNPTGFELYMAQ